MPMATRSSSLSKNYAHGAVTGPSTKTSSKRPNPTSEVPADLSSSLARPLKRTRVGTSTSKAPHKKRAGNENENMMTLPIEIFTQVLSYVTPCSLVALIRTNKALRRILLDPSSKPIWQSAAARVPGLFACPYWMPEPQFAALLFTTLCTLCGASTTLKPDPNLFARLCASCRNTGLVDYDEAVKEWNIEGLVYWSTDIKPESSHRFSLRRDVERVLQKRAEMSGLDGIFGAILLTAWRIEQRMVLTNQIIATRRIATFSPNTYQISNKPTTGNEPRYARLLFSKLCTLCGAPKTVKPGPCLFVRLCASCRDTGYRNVLVGELLGAKAALYIVDFKTYIKPDSTSTERLIGRVKEAIN